MDRNLRIRMLLEAGDRVTGPLRAIAGGSTKAAQALKLTRDGLREIERAQGDIAGFRKLKTGLGDTGTALGTARTRMAGLRQDIAATDKPTAALTRALAKAERAVTTLEVTERKQSQSLQEMSLRLHTAGINTNDLARHQRRLRTEAVQTNRTIVEQTAEVGRLADRERRMAAGRARFSRMQGTATGLAAGGAAAIGTGMAMAAPLIGSIKAAQDFQSVMTDIGQKADLSRAASDQLGRNLLASARAANQMPADLQAGVDALAGLGAKVPDAVAMMKPIGRAATAYKAEISDLSAAAFAATDNLKVPVAQTGKIIDVMASAGKAGAFEIKDMAQYFPALTAAYQGLGQTGVGAVADLAAGLQIARKGAGDAASAGSNLANILQKIASPATNKAFEKMGVDLPAALKKAYAEGKTPLEAIAELTNKTLKGDLSKLGYLFEDAQVQQGLRPLIQNMEEFRKIRAEAGKAGGTTDSDFADRMKDSAEQSKQLKVNATTLAITLGAQLLPTINAIVTRANAFATWIGDVANRYPNATKAVAIGAAAFAGLFFVLGGGAIVIAGLVAPFSALAFAAGALGIGMLPVIGIALAVVAGIVAIGAAAYLIYANWGAIGGWFAGLWQGIKGTFAGAVDWFASLPTRFAQIGRDMISGLIRGIFGMFGSLKTTIVGVASSAAGWFKAKLGIHSPSRVFAGFGGNIVDGLTNGIAAQEGEPVKRMDRLSSRLTSAIVTGSAIPALAMGGAAGAAPASPGTVSAAPRSYTIHINQQPGQDAQALARAVADELDRRDRETAARRRSSFADTPDYETV
ncbi:phage tail tape measure protein [Sphingomonas sp. STIS6.2]|uniref:phage tail tape measure protein n=1 Tax=Sphingomonas sp. STIS6.2 TaxID=1379700 RepID=UPI001F3F2598|nr:phage tail tape measure protein [Sphingomonas sp. STIS6.2]